MTSKFCHLLLRRWCLVVEILEEGLYSLVCGQYLLASLVPRLHPTKMWVEPGDKATCYIATPVKTRMDKVSNDHFSFTCMHKSERHYVTNWHDNRKYSVVICQLLFRSADLPARRLTHHLDWTSTPWTSVIVNTLPSSRRWASCCPRCPGGRSRSHTSCRRPRRQRTPRRAGTSCRTSWG